MTLKTLAGKLLLFPIAIENWIVLSIGIAGTMTWLIGELEPGSSDPRNFILLAFFTFFRLLTIIFLIFGGLAWSLRWMRNRILTSPLGAKGGNFQPWLFLVIIILLVHGALAVVFAYPLPRLFQETIQLLERLGVWEGLRKGGGTFRTSPYPCSRHTNGSMHGTSGGLLLLCGSLCHIGVSPAGHRKHFTCASSLH